MRIEVNRKDIIWSYASTIMSMLANFCILPFVLAFLDENSIGLYYVFISLSGISVLFDFGFATSFSRNIAYCWSGSSSLEKKGAKKAGEADGIDFVLMKKALYASRVIYSMISAVTLLLAVTIGTWYIIRISDGFSGCNHIIAWFIYAAAIFMNLYYGYFSSYLRGVGAVQSVSKITTISRLLQVVLAGVLLCCGTGLIGVSVAYFAYGLVFRTACKRSFYRYRGIGEELKKVNEKNSIKQVLPLFKTIWYNAWREGIVSLSNYLLNQAGTVICSLYYSLYETGLYSLAVQLASAIATIASTMYTTYQPSLQSAYVRRDVKEQKKYMSMIVVTFVVIYTLGMLVVVLVGKPIISWIKPTYTLSTPMLLLVGLYQFILKFRNCYTTYFSSTNRLIYMPSFVISSFVCVALSVLLVEFTGLGVWGLVIAQIFSQIVFNAWYWTVQTHKELGLKAKETLVFAVDAYKDMLFKRKCKL